MMKKKEKMSQARLLRCLRTLHPQKEKKLREKKKNAFPLFSMQIRGSKGLMNLGAARCELGRIISAVVGNVIRANFRPVGVWLVSNTLQPIIRIQPIRSSIKVLRIIGPGCSRCGEELFCIESCPLRKDNISVTSFILRPTNAPDDCWKNSTANEKWDKDLFPRIASALFSHDKNNIPHEPDRIAHRPHGRG